MSSWLPEKRTDRKYKTNLHNSPIIRVLNEYQKIRCPNCSEFIFCRLTHIWFLYNNERENKFFYHTNHKKTLEELENLQVQYIDNESLYELIIDDVWKLKLGEKIIGEEIDL